MPFFKIACAVILSLAFMQVWAQDSKNSEANHDTENNVQNVVSTTPPVSLPQDQDEIDAAPDDHEFAPIEDNKELKTQP